MTFQICLYDGWIHIFRFSSKGGYCMYVSPSTKADISFYPVFFRFFCK